MKRHIVNLFILSNLFLAAVQAAEWEMQNRSIQFQTIWGNAQNDVFAIGHHGIIFHYNGSNWSEMDSGTDSHLYGIWGNSNRNVLAVGNEGTIRHYDGNTWSALDSGSSQGLFGIWGSSNRNVFAVGGGGTILHYDGSTWTAMNSGTSRSLSSIWGSSGSDLFAVGSVGTILHYDGENWSTMNSGVSLPLSGIWGRSSNDVFAVGSGGTILHYDGSNWTTMDSGTNLPLSGIWGSSSSNIFAVGGGGVVIHYDGSSWNTMDSGAGYYLNGVWGSSSRNLFAVGNGNMILHYDGNNWTTIEHGDYTYLFGIWGTSSRDVFAVGNSNQIFHYDGNQWSTTNSGSPFYLRDVWGTSSSEVFAVGWRGEILQYDGNHWTGMNSGTSSDLNSIWGSSSSDIFAVGKGGTILHYNGNSWKTMSSGTSSQLAHIWGNSSREVFVVGDQGTILRYTGTRWTTMNSGTTDALTRIWGNAGDDVFAVGDEGTILHYDGNTWTTMDSGTDALLNGIWGSSNRNVFAATWHGIILHYDGNRWTEMTNTPTLLNALWISPEGDAFAVGDAILYCADCQLGSSEIKVNPKLHNFWNIALGETDSQTFTVSNTNQSDEVQLKPLALTNDTEFSLSEDSCSNMLIAPAGNCQVTVHFQPESSGTKLTKLTLPTQTETIQVPIGGNGCSITFQQVFEPAPESPNFGTVWVGDAMVLNHQVDFTAIQGCGEQLYIDTVTVVGEHADEFSVQDYQCDYSKDDKKSYSRCQFNTTFTPISDGDKQAELVFTFLNHDDLPVPTLVLQAKGHTQSVLEINPWFHDFWGIPLGESDSQTFTVSNSGNIAAQLQQLSLTNTTEFTLNNDTCSNTPLAPTNTCQVTVDFQQQSAGIKLTDLILPSSTETLQIPISGTGCQQFYSYPWSPKLGAILVGDSITLSQTVDFSAIQGCGEQLNIEAIGVIGEHAAEFSVQDVQCHHSNYYDSYYSYCWFNTVFTPTSPGEKQAELIVKLSNAELPGHIIPLQAKGVDSGLAQLEMIPTEHDFGTVIVNRSSMSQSFLHNTGEVSLKVGNVMLAGEQAAEFSLDSWWCTNLNILHPGDQCNIDVWFSPTSLGQKQALLTVTTEVRSTKVTAEAILTGIVEGPKDCSDANITIESTQTGYWNTPTTWSTSQIPTETDVVRINQGHTITGQAFAKVRTLCIQEGAILISPDEPGISLEIQATDYLENKGTIRGRDGVDQTQSVCGKTDIGTAGCAQLGANVILRVGEVERMEYWWSYGSGGPILNTGEIIAGKGGDGFQYGALGGEAIVLGRNVTNTNLIRAGDGGNILGTDTGEGGQGGFTGIWSKLGGSGHLYNQNGAKILAGNGGNCNNPQSQQMGGHGGNILLVSAPYVHDEGITQAGIGGKGCTVNGQDGDVTIDPNVISLAGAKTQVNGGDIAIYGGNDWTLDLSNLSGTVVEATGDITLAVGQDGLIDFRNSTGKILKADGEVQIFANNILLDPDQKILELIEANNIVLGPSRILRHVSLTGPGKVFGKPGETVSIQLILANNGPEDDSYLVTATDSTGQNLGELPAIPVTGLETVNVVINVVVPETNPITLTATSQADPETKGTTEVFIAPAPVTSTGSTSNSNEPSSTEEPIGSKDELGGNESGVVVSPNESVGSEMSSDTNQTESVSLPESVVIDTTTLNNCPLTPNAIIDWVCLNYGQVLTNVIFERNAKVAGGELAGTIDNSGLVSQVTIQPETVLRGGKLTGYIVNQGTLMDIEFVGAEVLGGTLAGTIMNKSRVGGVFKEVTLAADAYLSGGYLQGEIQGDPTAPALLEQVTILAGSRLSHVMIGTDVTWHDEVAFADSVQFVKPLVRRPCPNYFSEETTLQLPLLETMSLNNSSDTCTQLVGGVSTDGEQFHQQLTVSQSETVVMVGQIAVDRERVELAVDLVLYAAYQPSAETTPLYFMVDTQGDVLRWDGELDHLVAFQEDVVLDAESRIEWYRDPIPALGRLEVHFGYRSANGTVWLNQQPIEVEVVE